MPSISVIVPAHNNQDTIENCLQAIRGSSCKDYELIVVDSMSTDLTFDIAKKYADSIIRLKENPGRNKARTIAAGSARGDILVGVDSDIIIRQDTLSKISDYFKKNDNIDALTGILSKEHPNKNFFSQYKNLYMNHIFGKLPDTVTFLYGSIHAIRRRVVDLYHSDLGFAEDTAIGQQLLRHGKKIAFLRDLDVVHLKKYTFLSFVKNDFIIPFHWAGLFLKYRGWRQVGKFKTGFAHAPKSQIASVLLAPFIILMLIAAIAADFPVGAVVTFSACWFLLNLDFILFLGREMGPAFALAGAIVNFLDNIVMAVGIMCGFTVNLWRLFGKAD